MCYFEDYFMFDFHRYDYISRNQEYRNYCYMIFNFLRIRKKNINNFLKEVCILGKDGYYSNTDVNNITSKYEKYILDKAEIKKMLGLNACGDENDFSGRYKVEITKNVFLYFRAALNGSSVPTFINVYGKYKYLFFQFFINKPDTEVGESYVEVFLKKNKDNILSLDIERTEREFEKQYKYIIKESIKYEKELEKEKKIIRSIRRKTDIFKKRVIKKAIKNFTKEEKEFIINDIDNFISSYFDEEEILSLLKNK